MSSCRGGFREVPLWCQKSDEAHVNFVSRTMSPNKFRCHFFRVPLTMTSVPEKVDHMYFAAGRQNLLLQIRTRRR